MEAYPAEYVLHNLPLVVLSGLVAGPEHESPPPVQSAFSGQATTSINSELPPVNGERAQQLLHEFMSADGRNSPWNGRPSNRKSTLIGFRLRAIGRDLVLPPRKADAPRISSELSPPGSPTIAQTSNWILHSPLSPLTPGSSAFPDGVMSASWVAKHQHYVPSIFISFFSFTSDPNRNSLHDNQLKNEINKVKGQIQGSGYRTRYAVVLLSDKTILEAPDIEERLANIRRATGLDPKNSLFFLPPNTSRVEQSTFVHSVLSTLHSVCVEYYRDLSKHARRKEQKELAQPTARPTRGTSQPLPRQAWRVRYHFKLGVFAEFRQEMDSAQRYYGQTLEYLLGSDGVFETTASWSPRWDETRLLADAVALRFIRCMLWNAMPTSAVQAWLNYRARMRDVIDRRGKGSNNYGWEAWESRWAKIMAQLIQRADLPVFATVQPHKTADTSTEKEDALFSPAEKAFPIGERLSPWHLLHHTGYWLKLAAQHAERRRALAYDIPEEDRMPPGMSPATKVSHRNLTYDQYLVPEPHLEAPLPGTEGGFDHCSDIVESLSQAAIEYDTRGQQRMVDHLHLSIAKAFARAKRYQEAFDVIRPLWKHMAWRKERWWSLASEVTWSLHECAFYLHDAESLVATEWELLSRDFRPRPAHQHKFMHCLDVLPERSGELIVNLSTEEVVSCVTLSFIFSQGEGNVGEPLRSQVVIASSAKPGSDPITLSSLLIQFKGCLSEITINHCAKIAASVEQESASTIDQITMEEITTTTRSEQTPGWRGSSDLSIYPGQVKVLEFPIIFREAGDVDVTGSTLEIEAERFRFVCSSVQEESMEMPVWWIQSSAKLKRKTLHRDSGVAIKILPKPPKMEISIPNILDHYYTNEAIELQIEITNKEEEDTEAVLEVRLLGRSTDTLEYSWVSHETTSEQASVKILGEDSGSDFGLPGHVVGQLARDARRLETIKLNAPADPSDYALEVKVLYHVLSERDIPISKIFTADLIFVGPFEASYEFAPRVHPDPWPSFFEIKENETKDATSAAAFGIAQKWLLKAKVASFAEEPLIIQDMALDLHAVHGGAICDISKEFSVKETEIKPQELQERAFCLDTQKLNLEERRSSALDMSLDITWCRKPSEGKESKAVRSSLLIPRLHVPSSEPRVLATASKSTSVPSLIQLDYTLENPTMHLLTFELNMEASEEFGFSGPKLRAMNLLPLSRQTITFNILPLVNGTWITPQLKVVDRYFHKVLKVQGTDSVKMDKKGVMVWVDVEDEDGEE